MVTKVTVVTGNIYPCKIRPLCQHTNTPTSFSKVISRVLSPVSPVSPTKINLYNTTSYLDKSGDSLVTTGTYIGVTT